MSISDHEKEFNPNMDGVSWYATRFHGTIKLLIFIHKYAKTGTPAITEDLKMFWDWYHKAINLWMAKESFAMQVSEIHGILQLNYVTKFRNLYSE
jgi:hypothetical protein